MNTSKTNDLLNDINDKTSYSNSSFDTLIAKNDIISSGLGLIENDIEDTNTLLTTIQSDISVSNKYNKTSYEVLLRTSGGTAPFNKSDYSSTEGYRFFQNTT